MSQLEFSQLQVLVDLGLTLKEAKVYFTLVDSGDLKVSAISRISKVARPDVYEVISRLNRVGLVEKLITKPVSYRAIPIKIGLGQLLAARTNEYRNVRAETQMLLDEIEKSKQEKRREVKNQAFSQFTLIPEGKNVIERIKTAIETANQSVDVVLSWKRFSRGIINDFAESIENAWAKKVKIRFIIERPLKNKTMAQLIHFCIKKPFCQIRFIPKKPKLVLGIYDKKEVCIIMKPKEGLLDSPALWSSSAEPLMELAQNYFYELWKKAEKNIN